MPLVNAIFKRLQSCQRHRQEHISESRRALCVKIQSRHIAIDNYRKTITKLETIFRLIS